MCGCHRYVWRNRLQYGNRNLVEKVDVRALQGVAGVSGVRVPQSLRI